MKKNLFIALFALIFATPTWAFTTTITSSIYADDNNISVPISSVVSLTTNARRVRFINRTISTNPMLELAAETAMYIFTEELSQNGVELVPIIAEVKMGEQSAFGIEELCKVEVEYTDTTGYNPKYSGVLWNAATSIPTLYSRVLSNQTRGFCNSKCMTIMINPNIPLHYDITTCPSDKYDATTLLLRALAIGSGIQSSLRYVGNTLTIGIYNDDYEQICVTSFDSQMYNSTGKNPEDVVLEDLTIEQFLCGTSVHTIGDFDEPVTTANILLTNDWEVGVPALDPVSPNTLNTIDFITYTPDELNSDFQDLLATEIQPGQQIRTLTKYTKAILKHLGFQTTIAVGGPNPFANLFDCKILCDDVVLYPNVQYTFALDKSGVVEESGCIELYGVDSLYTIGNVSLGYNNTASYTSIPDSVQWQRNPVTKNILGHIKVNVSTLVDGLYISLPKYYEIEIPNHPNKLLVHKSEETISSNINLDLSAFANGSTSYTVKYIGVTNSDIHTFTVSSSSIDTTVVMPATQLYNVAIYGTNALGNSDTCTFTAGFSAHPTLHMTVSVLGSTLRYDFSNNGTIDISDLIISSVRITDTMGNLLMTSDAGSGEPIDISSLARGYYILYVEADGQTYGARFGKRW